MIQPPLATPRESEAAPPQSVSPIAVAIVNFNTVAHLRRCLQTIPPHQANAIVVVDNASTDGSAAMVRREFPGVTLLANTANPGYGAAANQAIAACDAPHVLLLNSDTRLDADALPALSRFLDDHPRAAIAGPRLRNADGTLQPSCYPFPTPLPLFLEESTLGRLAHRLPTPVRERSLRAWSHGEPRAVPWLLGAALAIRRAAWDEVGGFDERFFMYFEEVDLCRRLQAAGWKIWFAPVTAITHLGGASTGQQRGAMARQLWGSAAHFYRRHHSAAQFAQLRLVVAAIMVARGARDGARRRLDRVAAQRQRAAADGATWRAILGDAARGWPDG